MNLHHKHFALITAVCVFAAGLPRMPVSYRSSAAGERLSAADFARRTALAAPECNADAPFAALRWSETEQMLYRDETAVGSSFGGFAVRDGVLCVDSEAAGIPGGGWIPAEAAADAIGCEIQVRGGETVLTSPFQSGRLIVKSEQTPESCGAVSCTEGYRSLHVLQYDSPAAAYSAYQTLRGDSTVEFVEPDRTVHICEKQPVEKPLLTDRWGIEAIGADGFCSELRSMPADAPEIVVAVIDTGIYPNHVMFRDRIAEGGRCFTYEADNGNLDGQGHGTHCAGIVCSVTCDNVKILPLKALDNDGYGSNLEIYCAMMYAAEHGADVVSMSLGGDGESPLLDEACAYLSAKDIPVAVAAGNESQDVEYVHPANYPDNIVISALTKEDASYSLASYSNFGSMIDFAAPGSDILSAGTDDPFDTVYKSGTSMATPFAAGCIADLLTLNPDLTNAEIIEVLKNSAVDLGDAGFDEEYGWGMVSLENVRFPGEAGVSPTADPPAGTYCGAQNISLHCADSKAVIYYTTDGSMPSAENGTRYTGTPVPITESTLLTAAAVTDTGTSRPLYAKYEIESVVPFAEPGSGVFSDAVKITIIAEGADAVYYTLDGSDPEPDTALQYTGSFTLRQTAVLKAISVTNGIVSRICSEEYIIGGTDLSPLLEISGGVLTAYHGTLPFLDLSVISEFSEIRAIGDGAFAGNTVLTEVNLPMTVTKIGSRAFEGCTALAVLNAHCLTEIGDDAFRGCTLLSAYGISWETIRVIGDYAFAGALLSDISIINLDSLEQVGKYAFSDTKQIGSMTFGSAVTEIPEGLLLGSSVSYVRMSRIKTIGNYAFADANSDYPRDVYFDPSQLERLGAHALEFCWLSEASFPRLTEVGEYAFANIRDVYSLSLDALKTVPAHMTDGADIEWLILDSAETIGSCAISGNILHVVTGEPLKEIAPDAVVMPLLAEYYAGTPGSPMEAFAEENSLLYYQTPAYLPLVDEMTVVQFQNVWIDAVVLGSAQQVEFRCYADQECTQELPVLTQSAADDYIVGAGVDTFVPGVYYYAAGVCDDSGWHQTGPLVTVTVTSAEVIEELPPDTEYKIIDWNAIRRERGDDWCDMLVYGFTPEESGTYYIGADCTESVTVFWPESNEAKTVWESLYAENCGYTGVELNAGERVLIMLKGDWDSAWRQVFLTIRMQAPQIPLSDYRTSAGSTDYFYSGEAVSPSISVYRQTGAASISMLIEGHDYIVYCPQDSRPGELFYTVFGIGEYAGVLEGSFNVQCSMDGTGELALFGLDGTGRFVSFTPQYAGDYTVYTMYLDSELREAVTSGNTVPLRSIDTLLRVYDANETMLAFNDDASSSHLSAVNCYLESGETYRIGIESNMTQSNIKLCIVSGSRPLLSGWAEPMFSTEYTGEPLEGEFELRDYDGNVMSPGTDFYYYCFGNDVPDEMYVLAIGTGSYIGASWTSINVHYDPAPAIMAGEYETITVDVPFTQSEHGVLYRFVLTQETRLGLSGTCDPDGEFFAVFYEPGEDIDEYQRITAFRDAEDRETGITLDEGSYYMFLVNRGSSTGTYQLNQLQTFIPISRAEVYVDTVRETGRPIRLHAEVWDDDVLLTENKDYTLEYDTSITRCGSYRLIVSGIGDYSGEQEVWFSVLPAADFSKYDSVTGSSYTAPIGKPGDYQICSWKAEADRVLLWLDEPEYTAVAVLDGSMMLIDEYSGQGFWYRELNLKAGRCYYFLISYVNSQTTGDITMNLRTDYKLLDDCTAEYTALLPSSTAGVVPEFTVWDGDTLLTEHTDYEIELIGGETHCARAEIVLRGTGDYTGRLTLSYYLHPDGDEVFRRAMSDYTMLTLDSERAVNAGKMDEMHVYHFIAPDTGWYFLNRPDPSFSPAVVYVFKGRDVLPMYAQSVMLKEGEIIRLAVVGQALDDYCDPEAECTISVSSEAEPLFYEDGDLIWEVFDNSAMASVILNRY